MDKREELKEALLGMYEHETMTVWGAKDGKATPRHKYEVIENRIVVDDILDLGE